MQKRTIPYETYLSRASSMWGRAWHILMRRTAGGYLRRRFNIRHVGYQEQLPEDASVLIISTHRDQWTYFMLQVVLDEMLRPIMNARQFYKMLGPMSPLLMSAGGAIPVVRREDRAATGLESDHDAMLSAVREIYDQKGVVLLFPNGRAEHRNRPQWQNTTRVHGTIDRYLEGVDLVVFADVVGATGLDPRKRQHRGKPVTVYLSHPVDAEVIRSSSLGIQGFVQREFLYTVRPVAEAAHAATET